MNGEHTLHPTAAKLLATAVNLLDELSIDQLTVHIVLERSGVSYGSLYHHYSDISDLMEQAIVHRYVRSAEESIDQVRRLLDSDSPESFRKRAESLIAESLNNSRRNNRLERVAALGATQGRERLRARMARAQDDLTRKQAEVIRKFQTRGWVRDDVDAELVSVFLQALVIGRIVDEVSGTPRTNEEWSQVALPIFRLMLFPPQ